MMHLVIVTSFGAQKQRFPKMGFHQVPPLSEEIKNVKEHSYPSEYTFHQQECIPLVRLVGLLLQSHCDVHRFLQAPRALLATLYFNVLLILTFLCVCVNSARYFSCGLCLLCLQTSSLHIYKIKSWILIFHLMRNGDLVQYVFSYAFLQLSQTKKCPHIQIFIQMNCVFHF